MKKLKLLKKLKKEKRVNKYFRENIALLAKEVRELKRQNKNAAGMMVDSGREYADLQNMFNEAIGEKFARELKLRLKDAT